MPPHSKLLASRPDLFELTYSRRVARHFYVLAAMVPIPLLVFAVWSYSLYDSIIPPAVAVLFAIGGSAFLLSLSKRMKEWRTRDGRALERASVGILEDPRDCLERLTTLDPYRYTPMKVCSPTAERARGWLSAFWTKGSRVTYVVVSERGTADVKPPTIIEFHDYQHDTFHFALERGLGKSATEAS